LNTVSNKVFLRKLPDATFKEVVNELEIHKSLWIAANKIKNAHECEDHQNCEASMIELAI
jgi:hypothetical protein